MYFWHTVALWSPVGGRDHDLDNEGSTPMKIKLLCFQAALLYMIVLSLSLRTTTYSAIYI